MLHSLLNHRFFVLSYSVKSFGRLALRYLRMFCADCSVYEPLCLHQHWASLSVPDERRLKGGAGREAGGSFMSDVEP